MSSHAAPRTAWATWVFSVALTALGPLLFALNLSHPGVHLFDYWIENTILALLFSTIGAIIVSRRPDNAIGWIFCAVGLLGGVRHLISQYVLFALLAEPGSLPGGEALAWITFWLWVPHLGLMVFVPLLFPYGRLPGRRWRWIAWCTVAVTLLGTVAAALSSVPLFAGLGPIQNPLGIEGSWLGLILSGTLVLWGALLLSATISVFVRLHFTTGIERQQLKWFAYAAAIAVSGAVLRNVLSVTADVSWAWWVGLVIVVVGLLVLPVAIGTAILRYRLYAIDVVINRTLVYGALTASLGGIYLGGVISLQYAFRNLTGENSQLAIVASTLIIAVLFNPLRRRLQGFVDRRFYRRKYDAARTLEELGSTLRNATDLDTLTREVTGAIRETVQPNHVSL
jgi:hypothetical protein